ncbi:DegT/DnrJ/EryC1/StrS aminotransferase family protein [Arsukibacterium sp.]|uniref:DegT/DnrJ/EryC1/StrS aminotransferase family protein n=1 Tax=Arsukibacterium sp. TaxID=1977258 RepID=UPI001BD4F5BC|nr:DegT/DnrJ/EryC1/StrS aminotransferase family protein [Arsukibacterium sp.]
MSVTFSAPLMDAKHFPPSLIKAQPVFQLSARRLRHNNLPVSDVSTFSKARYALAAAAIFLKYANQQNTVLLPAYHCPALVEPFIYAGYNIVFYPQSNDLSSDLAVFESFLSSDVTHVVVVRYFGFSQNAELLMNTAFNAGKKVIEDNAHSLSHFWRTCTEKSEFINASVSSVSKTLGTVDGGVLYLPGFKANLQKPDFIAELKSLVSGFRPVKTGNEPADSFRYFQPAMVKEDCLRSSRLLLTQSNYEAIGKKRRENYQYLAEKLLDSSAGKVIYPELADDDMPYVLPFLLNDLTWFSKLRMRQIQVLRWEELASVQNKMLENFRGLLVQLPCHQNLKYKDLEKIASVLVRNE